MYVVYSTVREGPRDRLGEWERANLVVRTALNLYNFPFFLPICFCLMENIFVTVHAKTNLTPHVKLSSTREYNAYTNR